MAFAWRSSQQLESGNTYWETDTHRLGGWEFCVWGLSLGWSSFHYKAAWLVSMELSLFPRLRLGHCSPLVFSLHWKVKKVNIEHERTVQFYFNGKSLENQSLTASEWNFSYFLKINGNQKWSSSLAGPKWEFSLLRSKWAKDMSWQLTKEEMKKTDC